MPPVGGIPGPVGGVAALKQSIDDLAEVMRQQRTPGQTPGPVGAGTGAGPAPAAGFTSAGPATAGLNQFATSMQRLQQIAPGGAGAIAGLGGAIGTFVPAVGAATGEAVRQAFFRLHPALSDTLGLVNRALADLGASRGSGVATAGQFQRAFAGRGNVLADITGAQNAGNVGQVRGILRQEQNQAQQEMQE